MSSPHHTPSMILTLVLALAGLGSTAACKKGKDPEAPVDVVPSRPASPSGTMSLRGNYRLSGTVGTFEDCVTGERWRISQEGDHVALEEAYLDSRTPLGEPLLVLVEGGIDTRPSPGDETLETMLIVARFVRDWPQATCTDMPPSSD